MKQGSRLSKLEARKAERWMREHAELPAHRQAEGLGRQLGFDVSEITVRRWRKTFDIPKSSEAKHTYPVVLTGWELRTFRILIGRIVTFRSSDFEMRVSLEIPGLDEVEFDDFVIRYVVGDDWSIESAWLTGDELIRLKQTFERSDKRRNEHLADDLESMHSLATEFANRAYWHGVRKAIQLKQTSPAIKRIPPGKIPDADDEEEREWLRIASRKLGVQVREFQAAATLAVTG